MLRSPTDAVRREGLARDLLHHGDGASPTSATGTGWERTPWHATQRATWEALKRAIRACDAQFRTRASCPPRSRRARAAAVERRISRAHHVFPMQLQIGGN